MYTATKYLFLIFLFGFGGWATTSEFKDVQMDDDIVYSQTNPAFHDQNCNCQYCQEENAYYMEIAGIDSILKLGQELTVISIDTFQGLTAVTLK